MLDYLQNLKKKGGIIMSKKKKDENEHECKHEVGKSTINVNVNCSGKEHEPSAFKAVNSCWKANKFLKSQVKLLNRK